MPIKLWIDDIRVPPDGEDWVYVKTSKTALEIIRFCDVSEISFDHDLGGDDTTMPVAMYIEEQSFHGKMKPIIWHVHSANPVGVTNLRACLERADHFANKNK